MQLKTAIGAFLMALMLLLSVSGTTMAVVQSNTVGGDVFLGGTYIEVGIEADGSFFGTSSAAPTGGGAAIGTGADFHPIGRTNLGFVSDYEKNGWATASAGQQNQSGDFFLPGGHVQEFVVEWNTSGSFIKINGGLSGQNIPTKTALVDQTAGTTLKATWVGEVANGVTGEQLEVTREITFNEDDTGFTINVTLNNTGTQPLNDLYYEEWIDPDNDQDLPGGSFDTKNVIVQQGAGRAVIAAYGTVFPLVAMALDATYANVKGYIGGGGNPSTDYVNAQAQGFENQTDTQVNLIYSFGNLGVGANLSFSYTYVLDAASIAVATTPSTSGASTVDVGGGGSGGGGCFISTSSPFDRESR